MQNEFTKVWQALFLLTRDMSANLQKLGQRLNIHFDMGARIENDSIKLSRIDLDADEPAEASEIPVIVTGADDSHNVTNAAEHQSADGTTPAREASEELDLKEIYTKLSNIMP